MKKQTLKIIALILISIMILILIISVIGGIGIFRKNVEIQSLDKFAQCLASKNVTMYGAYWCSHCQNQKKMFGDSWKYMQYVECDVNGPNQQAELCQQIGIEGYPTWVINGVKIIGEVPIKNFERITGCKTSIEN
ncbi:MAG: hypothetical protein QXG00_01685 [Candidatus Woesearchaeota archaeon]